MNRWFAFVPPIVATIIGYLAFGIWGLAGGVAGALAAYAAGGAGAGVWVRSLAACLPPLIAVGPSALLVVAMFGLVVAWQLAADPRVFLFGALALFVPLPGASFVATACGALLVASAQGRWIAVGAALAVASWLLSPTQAPAAAVLALVVGFLARALEHHPANASVARLLVVSGVLLLCAPVLVGLALVSTGALGGAFGLLALAALGAAAVGGILLAAQTGVAALHLSQVRAPAVWSTLTWLPVLGVTLVVGSRAGEMGPPWIAILPLLGLMGVTFAVGIRWLGRARTRQEVPGKA